MDSCNLCHEIDVMIYYLVDNNVKGIYTNFINESEYINLSRVVKG